MKPAQLVDIAGLDDGDRLRVATSLPLPLSLDLAEVADPVEVEVMIQRTAAGFAVTGQAVAHLDMSCHRCLTSFTESVIVPIDDLATDDPDDGQPTVTSDRIDLLPIVRDAVGLSIPLRPLCRDDCLGLCPVCGNDLNSDPCGGHDEAPENPFAVLEHLLDPE